MKRIAALAALLITMLAVPAATAMASTTDSGPNGGGPGYGRPVPVQVACPLPDRSRTGHVKVYVSAYGKAWVLKHRHGKPVPVRILCPYIPAKPLPNGCKPEVLKFDVAAGGSTLTEVSGPVLAPAQEFSYDGSTYTIMSVNPGAGSFTVFRDNFLFVNKGDAITGGVGLMACSR